MTKLWLGCVVVLSMGAMGCGNPVRALLAEQDALADTVCPVCPEATGNTTELSCRADLESTTTATQEACIRDVYADNSAELAPIFDCQLDAQRDFRACVRTAINTSCPPSSTDVEACNSRASAARDRCATPSAGTSAELSACLGI